jgi:hypothetical protein
MASNSAVILAGRLRELERKRLPSEKTRPAREAAEAERRRRAEADRIAALEPLRGRLAVVVFTEIERRGRVLIKAQLVAALPAALLRSGPARDALFERPPS